MSDAAILEAEAQLGSHGLSACPEGAATLAAARGLRARGGLGEADRVVLINTGTAAKDSASMVAAARLGRGTG